MRSNLNTRRQLAVETFDEPPSGLLSPGLSPVIECEGSLSEASSSTTLRSTVRPRSAKASNAGKLRREFLPIDLPSATVSAARASSAARVDHGGTRWRAE